MAYSLAPGLSYCEADGHPVFLDLPRDRYVRLTAGGEAAFRALCAGEGGGREAALSQLAAMGILRLSDTQKPITPVLSALPGASLVEQQGDPAPIHARDLAMVAWHVASARIRLSTRALSATLGRLAARKARCAPATSKGEAAIIDLASRFDRARAFVPVAPLCLLDSIALMEWLLACHVPATLVMGVRLNPFAAHCWVQTPDLLLNDALDHARNHQPILVI